MATDGNASLIRAYRADHGRILAALIGQFRDFDLAEDALAEAFGRAAELWPKDPPRNPAGWLLTVARNIALDWVRKTARRNRPDLLAAAADFATPQPEAEPRIDEVADDRLRLIFTCCHPALSQEAQVALTLKTLAGLTVTEIARAFVIAPGALARRLTRAKAKIRDAGIPYQVPQARDLPERLPQVLAVIYLIYNEGYAATEGRDLTRADLAEEAIRLARLLHGLLPDPEVQGLLALLLHHDARRPARSDAASAVITLENQDRRKWDRTRMAEARGHLLRALEARRPGPYQIQAAISALHNEAPSWGETDWSQIAGLYAALEVQAPNPVVTLNRAVAVLETGALETATNLIASVAEALQDYLPFYIARAELHRRRAAPKAARADLTRAVALSRNAAETDFLTARIAAL
ncbi:MAG: sigma-70 family RNA polymerase sigma factor [Pseudomonadota bacterium]